MAREKALQDEDAAPETAGDFERLLIASPNESLLWVKFMAFKLGLADIDVSLCMTVLVLIPSDR